MIVAGAGTGSGHQLDSKAIGHCKAAVRRDGLKGDQICQEARILAVADTIEAMATHRPYRAARGLAAAMDEVRSEAGTKLDSKVVDAAFELLGSDGELQNLLEV